MTLAQNAVRRTVTYAAAAALTGGALLAGAGSASADTVVDITGVVTNASGAPLSGALVTAYVQSGNQFYELDEEVGLTDAAGRYTFQDLDAATLAADYPGTSPRDAAIRSATSFKLQFSKAVPAAELHSNPGYLTRAFGGTKTLTNSTSVPVNGTTASTANQALPSAGGMIVRITGATGAPVGSGFASLYAPESDDPFDAFADGGGTFGDDAFYDNPATVGVIEPAPVDGLVYVYGIEPGSYVVEGSGNDIDPATFDTTRAYLSRFIGGNGTYAKATPITVTAGAFASTGVQLTDVLTSIEAPQIIGNSSIGSTLKADPGTFLLQEGTEFSYQWTRGGKPVVGATATTYKLTKADKKKKIGLRVTAVATQDDGDSVAAFVGTASAQATSKVGEKSKVKAKRDGDAFDITVSVAKKGKAKKVGAITGKVVLLTEDGEVASRKAKLKGGQVNDLAPRFAFSAEKTLVVKYLGGGKLGSDTANAKLKGGGGGGKKKN